MATELKIPAVGESITEVQIGEWFVADECERLQAGIAHRCSQVVQQGRRSRVVVREGGQLDRRHADALNIETEIELTGLRDAPRQKSGAGEEHDGDRHLRGQQDGAERAGVDDDALVRRGGRRHP